jgi:hypothetical protein
MCHEWWLRRGSEEGEASRRLWDEFEHARPLRDPEVTEEEPEVTLETRDPDAAARRHRAAGGGGSRLTASAPPPRGRGARRGAPLFG